MLSLNGLWGALTHLLPDAAMAVMEVPMRIFIGVFSVVVMLALSGSMSQALEIERHSPIEAIPATNDVDDYLAPNPLKDLTRREFRLAWAVDPRFSNILGPEEYDWILDDTDNLRRFGPLEPGPPLSPTFPKVSPLISERITVRAESDLRRTSAREEDDIGR